MKKVEEYIDEETLNGLNLLPEFMKKLIKVYEPYISLTLIYIILKFINVMSCSWLWILSPLWISILVGIITIIISISYRVIKK